MLSPAAAPVPCSVFGTVAAIGDAWSWLILREAVLDEVDGFEAFHDRLGIARSTLSARLEHLIAHGVLGRTGRSYRPTERGSDFLGCLMTAMAWGDRWCSGDDGVPRPAVHTGCGAVMAAELRCSVLLVEQHVQLALEIADRAYVLSRGRVVLSGTAGDVASSALELETAYLGAGSESVQ